MRTRDLERYKKILLEMREKLRQEWESFEKEKLRQNVRDQHGQVSSFTTHPADMGSITDEQEQAFLLASHEQMILDAIDRALLRIANKTFGKCLMCGKNIEKERLSAVPYAEYCLECQEKIEAEETYSGSGAI
ncbi:TraR/DksA C4-type zinc finger protein [bacterium]|nr:TraR/DksA C4-type zinc finger protein [bacterium]